MKATSRKDPRVRFYYILMLHSDIEDGQDGSPDHLIDIYVPDETYKPYYGEREIRVPDVHIATRPAEPSKKPHVDVVSVDVNYQDLSPTDLTGVWSKYTVASDAFMREVAAGKDFEIAHRERSVGITSESRGRFPSRVTDVRYDPESQILTFNEHQRIASLTPLSMAEPAPELVSYYALVLTEWDRFDGEEFDGSLGLDPSPVVLRRNLPRSGIKARASQL
jgi:hypothetical protein